MQIDAAEFVVKDWKYYVRKHSHRYAHGALAVLVFTLILLAPLGGVVESKGQQACLAMLALVLMLWILEVVELYVTALLVPILTVTLGLLDDTVYSVGTDATARTLALKHVLSLMWNETITLLLGGFTIAAALSKTNLAKMFASMVIKGCGDRMAMILLGCMLLSTFLSMFISNVAAPVLMYSVVDPFLRTYDATSPFSQVLVLGIAFASNCGGMISPIASP